MGKGSFIFRRAERGAAFLEFAISFPLYMMVVLSIIELLYYNFQCSTAQYIVSQAADALSKGVDDKGNPIDLDFGGTEAENNLHNLRVVKQYIVDRARDSRLKSDFGSWQKQDFMLTKRNGNPDSTRKSGQGKFSGVDDSIINGGVNPPASLYGNISICAIGNHDTLLGEGGGVAVNGRIRGRCGWTEPKRCSRGQHNCSDMGTSALQNQSMPPRYGLPVVISIRYPHKPIAMSLFSGMIGAIPIQAEAIARIEP